MSGKVRSLVPYFVPGQGDTVNESLSHYTSPTKSSPSRVSVNVRKWDHAEGYFKHAVHLVHDHHEKPTLQHPVATQPSRLLTPAEIRQAREKALASSPSRSNEHTASKSPRNVHDVDQVQSQSQSPNSSPPRASPSEKPKPEFETPPGKQRPFAGSTFETASPPPSGLPIPGFVKSRTAAHLQFGSSHDRERAAVDLKRLLRI